MVQSVSISATALLLAAGARACTFPPEERSNGILEFRLAGWLAGRGGETSSFPICGTIDGMGGRTGGREKRYGRWCVRAVSMVCMYGERALFD